MKIIYGDAHRAIRARAILRSNGVASDLVNITEDDDPDSPRVCLVEIKEENSKSAVEVLARYGLMGSIVAEPEP